MLWPAISAVALVCLAASFVTWAVAFVIWAVKADHS